MLRPATASTRLAAVQLRGRQARIFLAHGPAYLYRYGHWRLVCWVARHWPMVAQLDDRAFFGQMRLDWPGLEATQDAVRRGDYEAAQEQLWSHFRGRSTPRFFWAPDEAAAIAELVGHDAREATLRRADDVCHNVFQFRRAAPIRLPDPIDWTYCPDGNVDWTWDLNRHQYLETLGRAYTYSVDERYARKARDLLLHWLTHNHPRASHRNWASVFEVAFRINTWLWAFHYLRNSAAFDPAAGRALLEGLLRHGQVLDAQLELHAANNHLLLEAKALAMLGLALPEFRQAARWRERGLRLLFQEVRAQVCADGVHGERVTHYQRAIAGELLEVLLLLQNNSQPVPDDLAPILARMLEFEQWITKPNGNVSLFGDAGLEDGHIRFAPLAAGPAALNCPNMRTAGLTLGEADLWLVGSARAERYQSWPANDTPLASRAFPQGGFLVMRHGQGMGARYLAMDAGPFGYHRVPSHGHADALNVELHADGQTFLVDPGGYGTWAPAEWRNYFRSTRAHNTVVVDDEDQSILVDTRHVYRPAQVTLHNWLTDADFDLADASHNGYERLPSPVTHRRQVLFVKPEYWIIVDILLGAGEHTFDAYFHFMPDAVVVVDPVTGVAEVGGPSRGRLCLLPVAVGAWQPDVFRGDMQPIQGWTALYSGEKQPAPVLRYRHKGPAPVQFCTVLYPIPAGQTVSVRAQPLEVTCGQGVGPSHAHQLTGLQIEMPGHTDLIVLDRGPQASRKRFAGIDSAARLTFLRRIPSAPAAMTRLER